MKRFLLWIISVALGVALLLAAVMGVSYAFTTQGGCPDAAAQFGGQELETNGFCWQVPLPALPPSRCRSWAPCTRRTRTLLCRTGPATPL